MIKTGLKDKKALSHYLGLENAKDLKKIKYKKALKYAIKNNLNFCLNGDYLIYFKGENEYIKNEYIKTINDITLFKTIKKQGEKRND